MNIIKYIFFTLIFLYIYYLGNGYYNDFLLAKKLVKESSFNETRVASTYELPLDKWLEFDISSPTKRLRILSNGNILSENATHLDPFHYEITCQVLQEKNKKEITYNHYNYYKEFIDKTTQEKIKPRFFLDDNILPLATKKFYIDVNEKYKKLRCKLTNKDEGLESVVIRAYLEENLQEQKIKDTWNRLSTKEKENLAIGNVYTYDLLNWDEKKNNITWLWKPFGPLGVKNKSFIQKELYIRKDSDEYIVFDERNKPNLDQNQTIVFNLNNNPGIIKLNNDFNGSLLAKYIGDVNKTFYLQKRDLPFVIEDKVNTLEITTDQLAFIEVSDINNTLLEPAGKFVKYYSIDSNYTTFDISFIDGYQTPIKIQTRCINEVEKITINLGEKIFEYDCSSLFEPYDKVINNTHNLRINKPDTHYFFLDNQINKIKIKSTSLALVKVDNKIPSKKFTTVLPETEDSQIYWYGLQPRDFEDKKVIWVFIGKQQLETIDKNNSVLVYEPTNQSRYRTIVTKANSQPKNQHIKSFRYTKLKNNQEENISFIAPLLIKKTNPEVIYSQNKRLQKLKFYIDNKLFYTTEVFEKDGSFELPQVDVGDKTILIQAEEDLKIWIQGFGEPQYIKRDIFNLHDPVVFKIKKSNQQKILSFIIYRKSTLTNSYKLNVQLQSKLTRFGPYLAPTNINREYIFNEFLKDENVLLETSLSVNSSPTGFFRLGDDLPSGEYEVKFWSDSVGPAYIYLYEAIGDDINISRIYKEDL